MSLEQENKLGAKEMTDSCQCDKCGRHLTSSKNRIQLDRKIPYTPNKYEYISHQDSYTDFELIGKKMSKERRLHAEFN
jgi:hypothetical protein